MEKIIDFNKTVYELVKEYPEIKTIMVELGFKDIVKPFALEVMGRHMTIIKGSKVKEIPLSKITETFKKAGFTVLNGEECKCQSCEDSSREALLRGYIERLNNGEDLETIRKEFVANFEHVSVHDIINVEQDIINSGTDVNDVQKLCDLHSALFHGMTEEEVYRNEEKSEFDKGFPINILKLENKELSNLIDELKDSLDKDDIKKTIELVRKLKEIKRLYQKKEELLMPLLYERGVTGPSDVMWGVDDEIKAEYSSLSSSLNEETYPALKERIYKVSERSKEMIYKEENILFPLALEKITLDEWVDIYFDIDETGFVFVSSYPKWKYAEERREKRPDNEFKDGYVTLDGGRMKVSELSSTLMILINSLLITRKFSLGQIWL